MCLCTSFSISLVCPADMQKRALASVIGVAGKPTTTTPTFLSNISRANALTKCKKRQKVVINFNKIKFSKQSVIFISSSKCKVQLNGIRMDIDKQREHSVNEGTHCIKNAAFSNSFKFLIVPLCCVV